MLELWGMQSTPLLPSLPGQLSSGVISLDNVLSIGQIELFGIQTECKEIIFAKLNC